MKKKNCRISNSELEELFSLGDLCISDFLKNEDEQPEKFELKLMLSKESGLVQLESGVDPDKMYGRYWYRSGTNNTMRKQLKNVVDSCLYVKKINKQSLWLDIACNDGTLLSYVPEEVYKLGIDPVEDSYVKESSKYANQIIQDYFSKESYQKSIFKNRKCDVVTCIAMFYDLEDPKSFLNDVYEILDDNGLFVIQMSYTPLMINQLAFDNICHEHLMYYNLHSIKYLVESCEFKIVDCELNDVNGGSFRVYLQKNISNKNSFATAPYRDVANFRVDSILNYEKTLNMNDPSYYINFYEKIKSLKDKTYNFVKSEKEKGKSTWVYGASTKGNTLLQYFGLDNTLIDGAAERSPYKFGLKTVGTNIPIFSEEDMRKAKPDYLLVLPWHFIDEFVERESDFLKSGGKFIVPCPNFEIISI
jgi:SAM-dependent methyltransferase